jgi:bacterioferritin (cytochrome b1)
MAAKAKSKSKPKATGPMATALAMEKKSLASYEKMLADATKKNRRIEMNLFRGLRGDADKHVRNIERAIEDVKKEEAKAREKARMERERAAKAKAAKAKVARPPAPKPYVAKPSVAGPSSM